jgi:hypothetical protein
MKRAKNFELADAHKAFDVPAPPSMAAKFVDSNIKNTEAALVA